MFLECAGFDGALNLVRLRTKCEVRGKSSKAASLRRSAAALQIISRFASYFRRR